MLDNAIYPLFKGFRKKSFCVDKAKLIVPLFEEN